MYTRIQGNIWAEQKKVPERVDRIGIEFLAADFVLNAESQLKILQEV